MLTRRTINVIHLGVGFLVLYSADTVLSSVQKLINHSISEDDPNYHMDGYVSLGITYLVFGLSFIFAPSIITLMGSKLTMLAGACGIAAYYYLFSLEITWVAYLGSALSGVSSSLLLVAQRHYLVLNAHEHTLSRDVNVFWIFCTAAQITGNVLMAAKFASLTRLGQDVRRQTCYIIAGLCVTGGIVLSLVGKPIGSMTKHVDESRKDALKNMWNALKNKNVLVLFFMSCYMGFEQSFASVYASSVGFTNNLGDIGVVLVPLSAIAYGVGGCSAAVLLSLLSRFNVSCERHSVVYAGLTLQLFCYLGTVLNLPNNSIYAPTDEVSVITPNAPLALICAFGFGVGDSCFNTQIYTLLGFISPEASSQTVSLYKLVQSMSGAVFFFVSNSLGLHIIVLIVAIVGIIGVNAFHWVDLRVCDAENSTKG